MCKNHTFFVSVHDRGNNFKSSRRLKSSEFKGLKLNQTECGEIPYHCEEHIHIVRGLAWKRIMIGLIFFIIGLLAIPSNRLGSKLFFLAIGGGFTGYGTYVSIQSKKKALTNKPDFPVLPSFDRVQIRETLRGLIVLDSEANYNATASPTQGQLEIDMSLNPIDFERLQLYCQKYNLAEKFHAGFAVLEGSAGLQFSEGAIRSHDYIKSNSTVIPLVDQVKTQPFLNEIEKRNAHKAYFSYSYNLLENSNSTFFPIQLVLSFIPETDQRGIEIGVQWHKPELTNNYKTQSWTLEIEQIKSLELKLPIDWGQVTNLSSSEHARYLADSQTIIWEDVPLEQAIEERRYSFQMQFENQIDPVKSSVSGQAKVLFQKTLSGLEGVTLYFPTGGKSDKQLDEKKLTVKTEVDVDFELSLAILRYQRTRKVPEPDKKNSDLNRPEKLEFLGVSPNYKTITLLTDRMSEQEQGFYIKQVIENQPVTNSVDNVNVIKRGWTIFGRWYEGVYPIDFQLYLSGQEEEERNTQISAKSTTITLTVKGTYSNTEMEKEIENQWDKLKDLINKTFQQLAEEEPYREQEALPPSSEQFIKMSAKIEEEDANE